jgi:hypothetical protein
MAEAVGNSLSFSGQSTCQALDADPPSDPCERALKQYAALLLNMAWEILGPDCSADLGAIDPDSPGSVGEAAALVEQLIQEGSFESCTLANDIADAINTESALGGGSGVPIQVIPIRAASKGIDPGRRLNDSTRDPSQRNR